MLKCLFILFNRRYLSSYRFGIIEGEEQKSALYTIANPTGVARRQKSYLQKWAPEDGTLRGVVEFDESIASLAVRDDGRFVAVGTMFSGSVCVYIAFSLQVITNNCRHYFLLIELSFREY